MVRLAFTTLQARKSGMLGALTAVGLAVVLVVSCGILLESSLRAPISVERLSAAAVVVEGSPTVSGAGEVGVLLSERRRLPASVADRIRTLLGVRAAIADRSFPLRVVGRDGRALTGDEDAPAVGHAWESAALTPLRLASGHVPRGPR